MNHPIFYIAMAWAIAYLVSGTPYTGVLVATIVAAMFWIATGWPQLRDKLWNKLID